MKTNKINFILGYFLMIMILSSCVQIDDFETPKFEIEEPNISANTTINAIKSSYDQSGEYLYTFDADNNSIIEGFVISSDEAGNFYKILVIQDKFENPTSGIEVLFDLRSYFSKFNIGRKIYIKMAGLSVANTEGKYKIGYNFTNKVEEIPKSLIDGFIIRSTLTEQIIPKLISLAEFSEEQLNTYVQIDNLQFKNDEMGKTYAGEEFDEFNGDRVLLQCDNQITTILSTSTFSDFKSIIIPEKKGMIHAVLTKDFYAEKYILVLNNISAIDFEDENRCDPEFLSCDEKNLEGTKIVFFENFQEIKKTKDLEDLGWTNTNIYFGNGKFVKRTSQGNVSIQISAYNSDENPFEVWLITPSIDLDNSQNEILTIDTKASYDNGSILTVWVSSNFDQNIKEAKWKQLNVTISVGPGSNYINDYISSGKISLDCLEGEVVIALKYLGGDPGISTTYDIDNIKIMGN